MFYEAIFQPSGEMEYNADAKSLEGKTIAVQEGWIIEEGPFKGENCFYIPSSTVGWIPKSDLKQLKPISFTKCKEIQIRLGFNDKS